MDREVWEEFIRLLIGIGMATLPVVLTAVGIYSIRFLRKQLSDAYQSLDPGRQRALRELFGTFVLAAEQIYGRLPGTGDEKKEYVIRLAEAWAKDTKFKIPPSIVRAFIEAAVYTEINGPSGIKVKEAIVQRQVNRDEAEDEALLPDTLPPVPDIDDRPAAESVANDPVV